MGHKSTRGRAQAAHGRSRRPRAHSTRSEPCSGRQTSKQTNQTEEQINKETNKQRNKQTNKERNRGMNKRTHKEERMKKRTNKEIDKQSNKLVYTHKYWRISTDRDKIVITLKRGVVVFTHDTCHDQDSVQELGRVLKEGD